MVQPRFVLQVIIAVIVSTVHLTIGLPSAHLSPEMSDALHLLTPGEQFRFTVACLGRHRCSLAEVMVVSRESFRIDPAARERFWHTYACMWSEDQSDCPVDGGWSVWGEWGDCDTTCGDGTKMRYRLCDWPSPINGGNICHGQTTSVTSCRVKMACPPTEGAIEDSVQQRAFRLMEPFNRENDELRTACMQGRCSHQQVTEMITPRDLADAYWTNLICYKHFEGCAVDGGWSKWNAWSSCSSRCGTGRAYRSRRCTDPRPQHNGRDCQGPEYEEGACFDDSCVESVGVLLTPWSMWSACSSTCNEGVRTSTRRCHGSDVCDVGNGRVAAVLTREVPCTEGLCSEDGGWGDWSDWTVCTGICGQGRRMKERACINPRPQGEGSDCLGDPYEMGSCTHNAPFCDGIPMDVQMYETWSHWSACSSPCDGGMRIRHRTCPEQEHLCRGELYDLQMCNEDLRCEVDGGWTDWTEWSVCTVTCGEGASERHRQCSHPRPQFGGRSCRGDAHEKRKCQVSECPASAPTWETWGQWSQCTVTCGGGTNTRTRGCFVSNDAKFKIGGWTAVPITRCIGEYRQINVCNFLPCPVDGNWASWGDWGGCSRACGEGVLKRDRSCTDPAPAGGGQVCGGYGTEIVLCYEQPCPEPEDIVRTFDGAAFMMYRHAATPTRHLLIYMKFKPSALNGLLALRHHDVAADQAVSVGVSRGHVRLYAKIGEAESEVVSADGVRLNEWNTVEVTISGENSGLRVNDGVPAVANFTLPLPTRLDWDQPMFVGGAMPHLFPGPAHEYVGFVGEISALRVNYKEYTLHDIRPEWTGVGLPFVGFNADTQPADTDAQVTVFTGAEFTFLPSPKSAENGELSFKVVFRPDGRTGIILYSKGQVPGSFVALTMADTRVALSVNLGDRTYSAKTIEIALSKWAILQLTITGKNAEMRVNGGPAVQLTATGASFAPTASVYIGGIPASDRPVAFLTAGTDRGLAGAVYEVTVNQDQYLLSETALSTGDMYLDSASTTLSAHYREVRKLRHSSVLLNCSYSNIHSERPIFTWLRGDQILENSAHLTIVKPTILLPRISTMSIHELNADSEGMYACMVWYRGKATITHAFGISVYELHFVEFRLESSVELMVVGNLALVVGFVIGIFALSCCKVCRKRYFFLDMMYQSILFYFGLDSCACLRDPNVPDRVTVLKVNATYDKDFSAREEKLKFDRALKKKRLETLKQKAKQVKGKLTEKRARMNREKDAGKKEIGDAPIESAKPENAVHFKTTQNTNTMTSSITVTPNEASATTTGKCGKSESTQKHRNENQSAGSRQHLQRRPSESLSDREIDLRRLSHEIVTGKSVSSTSASSPGEGSMLGDKSPEMMVTRESRTLPMESRESLSSLVLQEGEKPMEQEDEEEGQCDASEEAIDEPVYVNVQTIRERRLQSHPSRNNEACIKKTSSASCKSETPPGVASPDTRQKLLSGEPVEVDMDAIHQNWQKSKHDKEVLMSSDPDSAGMGSAEDLYCARGINDQPKQEQRRQSVAQAVHEAGRLFSHRGSIGGAVAKLSEAVADEVDDDDGEKIGLKRIDEGAVEEDEQSVVVDDADGADTLTRLDSASLDSSLNDKDDSGSERVDNESDGSPVSETDFSE